MEDDLSTATVDGLSGPLRAVLAVCSVLIVATCSASCHSPTTPVNAAPTVTVAFLQPPACTPLPDKPCTLAVKADASDADGDPLTFVWSGCATGASSQATCTVDRPGPVVATVDVSDGHGHTVRGTAAGEGTNQPPIVQIGAFIPIGDAGAELFFSVFDPDEGYLCGWQYCESATASGACKPTVALDCSCRAGLEAEVWWTASSGTCTVTFRVKDSWGLVGTTTVPLTYPR
jgi:hypothetical protein